MASFLFVLFIVFLCAVVGVVGDIAAIRALTHTADPLVVIALGAVLLGVTVCVGALLGAFVWAAWDDS